MSNRLLSFTKMQGTGNDFIVLDLRSLDWDQEQLTSWTRRLCERRYGIGADGVLALNSSDQADYTMIYKNADGSNAGMCGNGGRCIARYAVEEGIPARHRFQVHDQFYHAEVDGEHVLLHFPAETRVQSLPEPVDVYQVYPGTEHIVLPVEDSLFKDTEELRRRGRQLRNNSHFQPVGTNVNFFQGNSKQSLSVRTYERGVEDLTPACGTGAIASALAWHNLQQGTDGVHTYTVEVEGGTLQVSFTYNQDSDLYTNLKLGGPAHFVFEGKYYI